MEFFALTDFFFYYSELVYASNIKIELAVYRNRKSEKLFNLIVIPKSRSFHLTKVNKGTQYFNVDEFVKIATLQIYNFFDDGEKSEDQNYWSDANVINFVNKINQVQHQMYIEKIKLVLNTTYSNQEGEQDEKETDKEEKKVLKKKTD